MKYVKNLNHKGVVYLLTNTVNNKVYVGQTIKSIKSRMAKHKHMAKKGSKLHLYCAIRKYGLNVFNVSILFEGGADELDAVEIYYIAKYNSTSRVQGYNYQVGGDCTRILDVDKLHDIGRKSAETRKANGYSVSLDAINKIKTTRITRNSRLTVMGKNIRKKIAIDYSMLNELILSGLPFVDVVKSYGVTLNTINRHIKKDHGMLPYQYFQYILTGSSEFLRRTLTKREKPNYIEIDIENVKRLLAEGNEANDIAKILGVSYPTLLSRFIEYENKTVMAHLNMIRRSKVVSIIPEFLRIKEVANRCGVTERTINRICEEEHGVQYTAYRKLRGGM